MTGNQDFSMSQVSLHSQGEDWDRSLCESDISPVVNAVFLTEPQRPGTQPFPGKEDQETPRRAGLSKGKPSLSELLRLRQGTDLQLVNVEEASCVADVLGQWINSNSTPYEGEDDFFSRSQDDLLLSNRSPSTSREINAHSRGHSESKPSLARK